MILTEVYLQLIPTNLECLAFIQVRVSPTGYSAIGTVSFSILTPLLVTTLYERNVNHSSISGDCSVNTQN